MNRTAAGAPRQRKLASAPKERTALDRFRPFLCLEESGRVPLMIQGVRYAWDVHLDRTPQPRWFERFLTPQFRAAMAGMEGCGHYAVFAAEDVPAAFRSVQWRRLIDSERAYERLDLLGRVTLLRALGALSLYRDVERLMRGFPLGPSAWTELRCQYELIGQRVRFLLREPRLESEETAAFLEIAEKAPGSSVVRLEAAIFFLSRALEKQASAASVARGNALAKVSLAALKRAQPSWEHARWESKYWRCVSYGPYLRGRPNEARRQLALAEAAARESMRLAPKDGPAFGLEDLYGVLTTKVLTELKLGFPERCRETLSELIAIDPEGSWQRLELGRVLMASGHLEEAAAELEEGVRLGPPRRAAACRMLAECCSRLSRTEDADRWRREGERLARAEAFHGEPRRSARKARSLAPASGGAERRIG